MFQNTRRFNELRTYVGHRIKEGYGYQEVIEALGEMELLLRSASQVREHQILKSQASLTFGVNIDDILGQEV